MWVGYTQKIKHLVDPSVDYSGVINWNKKIFNVVSNDR